LPHPLFEGNMKLEKRVQIALPVRLHQNGQPAHVWDAACTYDISAGGARLTGMHGQYSIDEIVTLERGKCRASFRVAWVGRQGTPLHRQMGVQLLEHDKQVWDLDLAALQEQYEPLPQSPDGAPSDQVDISLWPGAAPRPCVCRTRRVRWGINTIFDARLHNPPRQRSSGPLFIDPAPDHWRWIRSSDARHSESSR
jgi:hypothetical protein